MSFKFVFRPTSFNITMDYAVEIAYLSGYKFLSWNGKVYFLVGKVECIDTGLTISDLY